jgi:hypothetical protein
MRWHHFGLRLLVAAAAAVGSSHVTARADTAEPSIRRVRGADPAVTTLIAETAQVSATFRRLLAAVERTDGLVYVLRGRCPEGLRACLLHTVTLAGPNRLLKVMIDERRVGLDARASLGHELQHAVEVLSDPTVTTNAAIYRFYDTHASRTGNRFETAAALAAGAAVRAEIRRGRTIGRLSTPPPD